MKVGIIETHYHSEFLNTLINLFDKPDVFTTKKIYNDLPEETKPKANYSFYTTSEKAKDYLDKIDTSQFDYLFVNTIQPSMIDLYKWKKFSPKCKSILTLHNLRAWSNKKLTLRKNIFHSADSVVSNFYCRSILNKFDYINVVNPTLIPYAKSKFDAKVICIPFSYALDRVIENKKDTIDFVIPGTVDFRRRDYETVIDAFDVIHEDFQEARLIFLGKSKHNITFLKYVKTFSEFVPRDVYNSHLRNADFIICPCRRTTHTVNTISEQYGITKSPNIFDCIKWRKPLLLTSGVPIPDEIKESTFSYGGSDHLYDLCKYFLEDKRHLRAAKKTAVITTKDYTLKKIKENMEWMT